MVQLGEVLVAAVGGMGRGPPLQGIEPPSHTSSSLEPTCSIGGVAGGRAGGASGNDRRAHYDHDLAVAAWSPKGHKPGNNYFRPDMVVIDWQHNTRRQVRGSRYRPSQRPNHGGRSGEISNGRQPWLRVVEDRAGQETHGRP